MGDIQDKDQAEKNLRQLPKDLVTEVLKQRSTGQKKQFRIEGLEELDDTGIKEFLEKFPKVDASDFEKKTDGVREKGTKCADC